MLVKIDLQNHLAAIGNNFDLEQVAKQETGCARMALAIQLYKDDSTLEEKQTSVTAACKVVYAGSSSYYGGVYLNPYAFAKWQGEEVFKMYSAVYDSSCGIARFFNVYGPRNPLIGQYTPVVAIFEEQTKANQTLTIVGDGDQRRDFTHVYDICDGLIAISNGDWRGEVFNLGTGTNHSVNELAKMFGGERKHLPERKGEARETLADISFTTEKTGWTPNYSLEGYVAEWSKNR